MVKLLLVSLVTAVLSGCSLVTSPILEVVNLAGTAATGVATMTKDKPANPVVFEHEPIKDICIELNGAVPLSEFVPSLQGELKRHGVPSRVYDAGTQPGNCPMTLVYTAAIKWDIKMFAENYSSYMTYASITLRKDGRVVGSAQYRIGRMGQDKWSSIGSKIGPLVDALLISNPEVDIGMVQLEKKDPTFSGS